MDSHEISTHDIIEKVLNDEFDSVNILERTDLVNAKDDDHDHNDEVEAMEKMHKLQKELDGVNKKLSKAKENA